MPNKKFFIIGIEASKESLRALLIFFKNISFCQESSIILKHNLTQKETDILKEIITMHCPRKLISPEGDTRIKENHIYIIKKDHSLSFDKQKNTLTQYKESTPDSQCFMTSLARDFGESAIGIILSETPDIDTSGLKEIKKKGGMTILQKQKPAELKKLRINQDIKKAVSFHLSPSIIPKFIKVHIRNPFIEREALSPKDENTKKLINEIFDTIKEKTNIDFSGYKLNTICRRLDRRINLTKTKDLNHYVEKIKNDPKEVTLLQQSFLINVTNFFRDEHTFDLLKKNFVPALFANAEEGELKIWCAACSSGEEAYSLAITLQEFKEKYNIPTQIQIIASDISTAMIQQAKYAVYTNLIEENVPPTILKKYFSSIDEGYRVNKNIRDLITFKEENVLVPSEYKNLDMISCRNFMIYLTAPKQEKIISIFHKMLKNKGLLLLGSAETLKKQDPLFATIDYKHKIFRKKQ